MAYSHCLNLSRTPPPQVRLHTVGWLHWAHTPLLSPGTGHWTSYFTQTCTRASYTLAYTKMENWLLKSSRAEAYREVLPKFWLACWVVRLPTTVPCHYHAWRSENLQLPKERNHRTNLEVEHYRLLSPVKLYIQNLIVDGSTHSTVTALWYSSSTQCSISILCNLNCSRILWDDCNRCELYMTQMSPSKPQTWHILLTNRWLGNS